jgi:hypothetical protein
MREIVAVAATAVVVVVVVVVVAAAVTVVVAAAVVVGVATRLGNQERTRLASNVPREQRQWYPISQAVKRATSMASLLHSPSLLNLVNLSGDLTRLHFTTSVVTTLSTHHQVGHL